MPTSSIEIVFFFHVLVFSSSSYTHLIVEARKSWSVGYEGTAPSAIVLEGTLTMERTTSRASHNRIVKQRLHTIAHTFYARLGSWRSQCHNPTRDDIYDSQYRVCFLSHVGKWPWSHVGQNRSRKESSLKNRQQATATGRWWDIILFSPGIALRFHTSLKLA